MRENNAANKHLTIYCMNKLYLRQLFSIFLKILPDLFALFFQHFAIFFPSMLVVFIFPAVIPSKAFLQLNAKIIKE